MSKLTVSDAAEHLGVSKEAIHNRIRRGSVQSVVENGVKLVIIDESSANLAKQRDTKVINKSLHVNDKYYKFLEEQNSKLQQKVETLESETRTLRNQKEQMLIQEREKIEKIYKEKDEQLKNIINAISLKLRLNAPANEVESQNELLEAEVDEKNDENLKSGLISLNKYLKTKEFSQKKLFKVKKRFQKEASRDARVIIIGKKYYIDIQKYDYSDFFKSDK